MGCVSVHVCCMPVVVVGGGMWTGLQVPASSAMCDVNGAMLRRPRRATTTMVVLMMMVMLVMEPKCHARSCLVAVSPARTVC